MINGHTNINHIRASHTTVYTSREPKTNRYITYKRTCYTELLLFRKNILVVGNNPKIVSK